MYVKRMTVFFLLCLIPVLIEAQEHSSATRPLVFLHVTVIDATGAPPQMDKTIVVEGDHIARISGGKDIPTPSNAQVVDAHGLYVIPGLWDMHVHIWETERALPMFIANGVTGVRNMGGHLDDLKRWREQVASGTLLGPRMVISGPVVDGPNPSHPDHSVVVHNAAEGREAVDSLKKGGADFIKVYDGVPREACFAIAAEARRHGISFAGHVPEPIQPSEASTAGQASIEHLGGILEEISTKNREIREIRSAPVKTPAQYPGRIATQLKLAVEGYDSQRLKDLAALFAKNRTWQVPTLVSGNILAYVNDGNFAKDPRLAYIAAAERDAWSPANNMFVRFSPPEYWVQRRAAFQEELAVVGELHRAGVPFIAGTDSGGLSYTYYGFSLHDELAFLVETGFTPMEALQAATLKVAQFLGRADQVGTITPGKQPDLVLLEANPLEDIRNTQRIRPVVVAGRYLDRASLDRVLTRAKSAAAH